MMKNNMIANIKDYNYLKNNYSNKIVLKKIEEYLKINKYTLSVVESCTGGLLSNTITNIPGSSKYFCLGLITYSNKSKEKLLKINKNIINKYGAVSKEIAKKMLIGLKKITNSNICLSITGIAGPKGGSIEKPIGLVYFGFYILGKYFIKKKIFKGNRKNIKNKSVNFSLFYLLKKIKGDDNNDY